MYLITARTSRPQKIDAGYFSYFLKMIFFYIVIGVCKDVIFLMLLCNFYALSKNKIYCHVKEPRHFFDLRITFASNLPFPIYKGLAVVCTCTVVRGGGPTSQVRP
jgi:hypothetical protein